MTLLPFQYQLGNVVFGKDTQIPVSKVDIQPANVNNQDFQIVRTDENRFGIDTLVPGTIVFTMAVLNNFLLDNFETPPEAAESLLFQSSNTLLGSLMNEWKANEIRSFWGAMKPLFYCDKDNNIHRIYGRPGKFVYDPTTMRHDWINVQAEFRRTDTLSHDNIETWAELTWKADPVYAIYPNNSDAWLRILLYGPIDTPTITIGTSQITLDYEIAEGEVVEISSYPWTRRVISSDGTNLRAKLTGPQYLDELKMQQKSLVPMRWTDSSAITWSELPHTRWVEHVDFLDLFLIGSEYDSIYGRAMWGFSATIVDWEPWILGIMIPTMVGGYLFSPFGTAAILDHNNSFTTANQYAQCRIATLGCFGDILHNGKSALVIMSNDEMTNFICLEIENNIDIFGGHDYLRIRTGTAYNALTTQSEYEVDGGFQPLDTVGIWHDDTTNTYTMIRNGENIGTPWVDSEEIVNTSNRRQGFILNLDNSILSHGPGLDDLFAYDIATEQPGQGKCLVLWRGTQNVI